MTHDICFPNTAHCVLTQQQRQQAAAGKATFNNTKSTMKLMHDESTTGEALAGDHVVVQLDSHRGVDDGREQEKASS